MHFSTRVIRLLAGQLTAYLEPSPAPARDDKQIRSSRQQPYGPTFTLFHVEKCSLSDMIAVYTALAGVPTIGTATTWLLTTSATGCSMKICMCSILVRVYGSCGCSEPGLYRCHCGGDGTAIL